MKNTLVTGLWAILILIASLAGAICATSLLSGDWITAAIAGISSAVLVLIARLIHHQLPVRH